MLNISYSICHYFLLLKLVFLVLLKLAIFNMVSDFRIPLYVFLVPFALNNHFWFIYVTLACVFYDF